MSSDRCAELGRALRNARDTLRLDGASFCALVERTAGRRLTKARLWAIERGEQRAADVWPDLVAVLAAAGAPAEHVARIEELLRQDDPRATSPLRDLADRLADLRASAENAAHQTDAADGREGTVHGVLQRRLTAVARAVVDAGSGPSSAPDPRDAVEVLAPTGELRTSSNVLTEIPVRLHNAGPVPWKGRFLLRIGPPVTSTISYTPPLLALPATSPRGLAEIDLPVRTHYLAGTCVVTYVMVDARGWPCLPGGLPVRITVVGDQHSVPAPSEEWRRFLPSPRSTGGDGGPDL
ncbi:MAG: hypothetical protein L0K86_11570 [Actinomycetia bacterium]|nr:hypothetical protein [Actinomycetes bacterium]